VGRGVDEETRVYSSTRLLAVACCVEVMIEVTDRVVHKVTSESRVRCVGPRTSINDDAHFAKPIRGYSHDGGKLMSSPHDFQCGFEQSGQSCESICDAWLQLDCVAVRAHDRAGDVIVEKGVVVKKRGALVSAPGSFCRRCSGC